jgi:hypothetical protein
VLTFQAVAHLVPPTEEPPPDPAVDPEGDPLELPEEIDGIADTEIGARLHENGSDLVARLTELSPLLVVLDEAHHLLEAWGSLLVETLAHLGNASVVALTGTPRGGVGGEQRLALTTYIGSTAYEASTVDLVRQATWRPTPSSPGSPPPRRQRSRGWARRRCGSPSSGRSSTPPGSGRRRCASGCASGS